MIEKEQKQKSRTDIIIIVLATLVPVIIYAIFGNQLMTFGRNLDINIWLRFLPVALVQYGLAGLGISLVLIYRKESLKKYGLVLKDVLKAIALSALVFMPHFIFMVLTNDINGYFLFQGMFLTKSIAELSFPQNVLGYGIIILVWGFFEGLTYIVISQKLNNIFPSKHKWLNYGAIICAIVCILMHGMLGTSLVAIFEMLTVFILVYGMILIKNSTNNAWGIIVVYVFLWNAF